MIVDAVKRLAVKMGAVKDVEEIKTNNIEECLNLIVDAYPEKQEKK